jgi:hypothetical protein
VATWATVADVLSKTGKTVTDQVVYEAEAVIEIYANRSTGASAAFSPRDLYTLKQAVCFQAAWMPDQPGYHQRNSYSEVSQDGVNIVYATEWQISLAPVAARALKNLSWKGARSTAPARMTTRSSRSGDFLNESDDPYEAWEPFSIGGEIC